MEDPTMGKVPEQQKTVDEVINENTKYFKFYEKMPTIITVILAILYFFVITILCLALKSSALWFVLALIGAAICAVTHFLLKVIFSYIILQISYLKKIEENIRKDKTY